MKSFSFRFSPPRPHPPQRQLPPAVVAAGVRGREASGAAVQPHVVPPPQQPQRFFSGLPVWTVRRQRPPHSSRPQADGVAEVLPDAQGETDRLLFGKCRIALTVCLRR
jgi:hypothetical protein